MSDLIETLRRHDPEPATGLTAAETERAEALLRQITADAPARAVATPTRPPVRRRRARTWLVVGAVTAAAAVGGVTLVGGDTVLHIARVLTGHAGSAALTSADIGSWTATPTDVPARTDVHALAVRCLHGMGDPSLSAPSPSSVTAHNVEQRGSVTSLVASSGTAGQRVWCLADADGIVKSELIDNPSTPLPPIAAGTVNVQTFDGNGDGPTATMSSYGQAGSDVVSLTITVPGRAPATTAVEDGLWSLWWPQPAVGLPELSDVRMAWTTKDGAHHSGTADQLVWDAGQ